MWNFRIIKDDNIIWLVEMFYQSKRKRAWYSDFLLIWNSKTEILNILKRNLKNNRNLLEDDSKIDLDKNWELWSKAELRMMINDVKNRKVLNIEKIKFWKSFEMKKISGNNFINI
jgi:hypothetical protein